MGGGEGKRSKNRRGINAEKVKKEEGMVVEKRKPKMEGASGPAGFGPQAQSVEARGQC